MTHEDGMRRCMVVHYDKDWNRLPQCILCSKCGQWITPEHMDDDCSGDTPDDKADKATIKRDAP